MTERKHDVTIANDLIRSAQGLNIGEKRLLMLAISKLDSKKTPSAHGETVTLAVSELATIYGLNPDKAYQDAKKAADGIMKRQIRLKPNDADCELIQWVGRAKYSKGEGWILIEFYYRLFPYLFDLKSHFTTYKLNRVSGLRSVYSWRFFELLMQFKSRGFLVISVDDFMHSLSVPESYKTDFSWLRMRVIEPAVKEIKKTDGLVVNWEQIKKGRKVTALRFTFPATPKRAKATQAVSGSGITKSDAKSRLSGLKSMAALSGETIQSLASKSELAAFKEYELI